MKFHRWWTVRHRSIFPIVWLSAQSLTIQYKSVRRLILVYNNTMSSWRSYRWQALINTWLWSGRTLNTKLVVQCYLVLTLMACFKCHVPARLQIGHHKRRWNQRQRLHGTLAQILSGLGPDVILESFGPKPKEVLSPLLWVKSNDMFCHVVGQIKSPDNHSPPKSEMQSMLFKKHILAHNLFLLDFVKLKILISHCCLYKSHFSIDWNIWLSSRGAVKLKCMSIALGCHHTFTVV